MWRPWRVRRRQRGAAAPAADGAGVGDQGTRHQHAAGVGVGVGEDVESNNKGRANRHTRQEKLSRRTSRFLGIRKRDTVRPEREKQERRERKRDERERCSGYVVNSRSVPSNDTGPLRVPVLMLTRRCIALVPQKVRRSLFFPTKNTRCRCGRSLAGQKVCMAKSVSTLFYILPSAHIGRTPLYQLMLQSKTQQCNG